MGLMLGCCKTGRGIVEAMLQALEFVQLLRGVVDCVKKFRVLDMHFVGADPNNRTFAKLVLFSPLAIQKVSPYHIAHAIFGMPR